MLGSRYGMSDPWFVPPDASVALDAKRTAAIAARQEEAAEWGEGGVQMRWVDKVPNFFFRDVIEPSRHPVVPAEEQRRRNQLDAQREFLIRVRELFNLIDADDSHDISLRELKAISSGERNADAFFKRVDMDSDGRICMDEFVSFLLPVWRKDPKRAASTVDELRKRSAAAAASPVP